MLKKTIIALCLTVAVGIWACNKTNTDVSPQVNGNTVDYSIKLDKLNTTNTVTDAEFDDALVIHNVIMKALLDKEITPTDNKELVSSVVSMAKGKNDNVDEKLISNVAMAYLNDYQQLSSEDMFKKMQKNNLISFNQLGVFLQLNTYMETCDYSSYKKFEQNMQAFEDANVTANASLTDYEKLSIKRFIKVCNNSFKLYDPYVNSGAEITCGQCLRKNIRDILIGDGGGALAGVGACLAFPPACLVLAPVLITIGSGGALAVRCPCCFGGTCD